MAEILCVRHGQASFASDNYDQLSQLGYRQATLAGEYFVKTGVVFDRIYAGTLKRQIQTAESVIAVYKKHALPVPELECDARWNELQTELQLEVLVPHVIQSRPELGALMREAKQDKKAFQKLIRATFNYWIEHAEVKSLGSEPLETWQTAQQRVIDVLSEVQANNGSGCRAGVFTSGGTLAILTAHAMSMQATSVYPLFEKVINCSLTRLIHNRQSLALSTFNEYSYLSAMAKPGEEAEIITYR
ncbi:MAG: broad specificity phosphatase PhoE [Cryomorphaceae bacterium]|jgi:broad specificity phosphatase PhoE